MLTLLLFTLTLSLAEPPPATSCETDLECELAFGEEP